MPHSRVQFLSLLLLSAMAGQGLAANCFNSPRWNYYQKVYDDTWGVRASLCGGSADCQDHSNGAITCQTKVGAGVDVAYAGFFASSKDNAMKYCWDAFNNIANQCVYSDKPGGFYHYGGSSYWLQPFVIGSQAPEQGAS
ncbi:hypothetical protein F4779DRAFT_620285 [Xylariaceae sp. FL0662B]|nr:hypothetical protein F4779DRAFT_620285 [Xylariaceae sp. FL0662B]